jgi:transposase
MRNYSGEFKLMLVKEYLEGELSYRSLAKKYEIPTTSLRGWVKTFNNFGENRLLNNKEYRSYSFQFKLDVLSFMERTEASVSDTAIQFGITSPSMISNWRKAFLKGNLGVLNKPKGMSPMSDKANNRKDKEITREQQLERENELLRLEVEYLKKLRAFRMDPEGYLEKHKQRYHQNSKKRSN